MIHTGSRGFGHQVASDYIETFRKRNLARLKLRDPQLVHAAIASAEGRNYLQALNAASNFAWANRQLIQEEIADIMEKVLGKSRPTLGLRLVYDQAHNIAKFERHEVDGQAVDLLVHRKGATRALPPGHPDIPEKYRPVGQPVIIPGSMGSCSYVLRGTAGGASAGTFSSSAHGAGRRLSRHQAVKLSAQADVRERMRAQGVQVFSLSGQGLKRRSPRLTKISTTLWQRLWPAIFPRRSPGCGRCWSSRAELIFNSMGFGLDNSKYMRKMELCIPEY